MKITIWILVLLLIVLHHDGFLWESTYLVGGFLPAGMAWHIGISLVSALVWYLATIYAWPADDLGESTSSGERASS